MPKMDPKNQDVPSEHHVHRYVENLRVCARTEHACRIGHWLSQDKRHHQAFLNQTIQHVDKNPKELLPVMKEFKDMVENDSRLYMLFNAMFDQVRCVVSRRLSRLLAHACT